MRAFEKIRVLVIWDLYFSGRMEMISAKRKVTKERDVEILFKNITKSPDILTWYKLHHIPTLGKTTTKNASRPFFVYFLSFGCFLYAFTYFFLFDGKKC